MHESNPELAAKLLELQRRFVDDPGSQQLARLIQEIQQLVAGGLTSLAPILPGLLHLKGKPYSLKNHFPFEPFFSTLLPRNIAVKSGRQVSKSTALASQGVVQSSCIPFFNTLYVTPLYEMIRRFSNNYVRSFIDQSPVRNLFIGESSSANVLQRSFANNSSMHFSFAFLDADRTRGLNCDKNVYDECQDLDETFIPIIAETMSGSPYGGLSQFAGTPKTLDGTLEKVWLRSSMAEWAIRCQSCRHINIPSLDHDLDDMIGPWHEDISEQCPATICAKCKQPVNPRTGHWWHRKPEKRWDFAGYHVPQIIMPMHYADPDKWAVLLQKRNGIAANIFYNEVCGESYDTGAKLVTLTDLRRAAVLGPNNKEQAIIRAREYQTIVMGVDWGGGGIEGVSYTVFAILGMRDNQIDVLYGLRSLTPHDHVREAKLACQLVTDFNVKLVAHDYTGAGAFREQFMVNAGFPYDRIVPVWYVPAATQAIMRFVEASLAHPRAHYKLDKARSLVLTCHQVKNLGIRFFDYDGGDSLSPGLLDDFLALTEERTDSRRGRDIYTIVRQKKASDDFAHAVNMACCTLWYLTKSWPDVAIAERFDVREEILNSMSPREVDWGVAT